MADMTEAELAMSIYFALLLLILCAVHMYKWAKKRKAAAIGLGMLMHMFMPVPNAERAITQVVAQQQIKETRQTQKSPLASNPNKD